VLATRSPGDCFDTTIEAVRIALRHMTPVMLLTDGYIANASELWAIPDFDGYAPIENTRPGPTTEGGVFQRDPATQGRRWAAPGDRRFIYRVGGIEKDIRTGNISYDAANHQAMTDMRSDKIARVADFIPDQVLEQGATGGLAVVAWGSTYGTLHQAVLESIRAGLNVAQIHLRYINPLPRNLGTLLAQFDAILVPELNTGQLATLLRDKLLVRVHQLNKVTGQPFTVHEVRQAILQYARPLLQEVRS
jgi:2-oxoglutarate ferredoxin oxidoreductase subunit alpha